MDWATCLFLGFMTIPVGMLARCIPDDAITTLLSLVSDVNLDALPWAQQDIESQTRSIDWDWPTRVSNRGSGMPGHTRLDTASERTWLLAPS